MADSYLLTLTIGIVDFLPYIAPGGIKWSRNDVDSENAGQLQNGVLRRDRIIMRRKLEITTIDDLTTTQIHTVMQAIYPEWVSVTFLDPLEGKVITRTFYSNNVNAAVAYQKGGVAHWSGITFPLIERGVAGEGAT
jgi:hypothetical protein